MRDIDALVRRAMRTDRAPGVALALIRPEGDYLKGYGVRGPDGAPVDPDTNFAIASVSKAFTAAACAALVDDGKMAFDDLVRKHLPAFRLLDPAADAHVTIRDLLCHRTGLPRHDPLWYWTRNERAEILRRMAFLKPTATYRGLYQYSNLCFLVAGEAAAAAAGEPFETYLTRRVLEPLAMERVSFSNSAAEADPNHATPHRKLKGKYVPSPYLDFTNVGPAGAMNASVRALSKWIRFHLDGGPALTDKTRQSLYEPQSIVPFDDLGRALFPDRMFQTYALGWLRYDWKGELVLSHGGSIDGFRSHLALLPRRKMGFAILSNVDGALPDMLRNALLDNLVGVDGEDWIARLDHQRRDDEAKARKSKSERAKTFSRAPLPVPLASLAGDYDEPGYGTATVRVTDDGKLRLLWGPFDMPLKRLQHLQFVAEEQAPNYQEREALFVLGGDGKPAELRLFDQTFVRRAEQK